MKIATWNIGEDEKNEDGKLNLDSYNYVIKTINKESIDIICLQEAITKSDYLPSIAEYIKENTDLKNIIEYELSDSHINIGSKMGVVICSKYTIDSYKTFLLDNPNFIYEGEKKTYYSHDKGFIISTINGYNIITGHCLPFHVFKKDALDYIHVFKKAEQEFIKESNIENMILCGDFNYENIDKLFPRIMNFSKDLINEPTRKDKQLDHFIISNNLNYSNGKVIDNAFDHRLAIFEISN